MNFSGKDYKFVAYGVHPETERIDYDEMERLAKEYKPKLIVGGASAYPRVIDFERMAEIAHEVGAYLMIDMALSLVSLPRVRIRARCPMPIS